MIALFFCKSVALAFSLRKITPVFSCFFTCLKGRAEQVPGNSETNHCIICCLSSPVSEYSVNFFGKNRYAAEQKARVTYDNILRLSDDPDVNDVIKFLREREIVHFQRFGEAAQLLREKLNQKNVYYMNPAMDM